MTAPFAFCQGPRPMRSRAFTADEDPDTDALRYARQVFAPAPAAVASAWEGRSAPASPPKSAPFPEPTLVTKNVMFDCCACTPQEAPAAMTAITVSLPICAPIVFLLCLTPTRVTR